MVLAKLQSLALNKHLPHAWLFVGSNEDHKLKIALQFSNWFLCANKQQDQACASCKACNLFTAQTHPDFYQITPQDGHAAILVEDIRALNNFITGRPQFSDKKIVLLTPAHTLNRQASNALLKNLEEASSTTIFLLLTTHTDLLLPTIVSRCQILRCDSPSKPPRQDSPIYLEICSDLQHLWVTKTLTPLQIVEKWHKQWPDEVLYWFELVMSDLLIYKYTQDVNLAKYADISNVMHANRLWKMLDRIKQARNWFGTNLNPNLQLILEDVVVP